MAEVNTEITSDTDVLLQEANMSGEEAAERHNIADAATLVDNPELYDAIEASIPEEVAETAMVKQAAFVRALEAAPGTGTGAIICEKLKELPVGTAATSFALTMNRYISPVTILLFKSNIRCYIYF